MKKIIKDIIPYIIIIVVVVLIRTFIITPVRVDGTSMYKTLNNNDILLLYKLGKVERYDVIVLNEEKDDEVIIKRVIALPGETIAIKNSTIYVNDKKIDDDYGYGETSDFDKITLKDNEYFILGDNRLISKDSRYFGPVTEDEIMGHVIFRIYPFNKMGSV